MTVTLVAQAGRSARCAGGRAQGVTQFVVLTPADDECRHFVIECAMAESQTRWAIYPANVAVLISSRYSRVSFCF